MLIQQLFIKIVYIVSKINIINILVDFNCLLRVSFEYLVWIGVSFVKLNKYTLYLDESWINQDYFSLAGVVIKNNQTASVDHDVKNLKVNLWPSMHARTAKSIILHQMVANQVLHAGGTRKQKLLSKFGEEHAIFSREQNYNALVDGIGDIIEKNALPVIGAAVDINKVERMNDLHHVIDAYKIATQIVVENYVNFLVKNGGRGNIIFESREAGDNNKTNLAVQSTFYMIKARGTLIIPEFLIQKHLNNVLFRKKSNNDCGLQIADFVPNNFARKIAGKSPSRIGRTLLNRRYDGKVSKPEYFGVRYIPYI